MRLTNGDRSNLVRFGCAFLAKQNLICIQWNKNQKDQAVSANIVSRLIHLQCMNGPLLFLAFETSPTRILPHYCFFPFDLTKKTHKDYLCSVFKAKRIQLCFLANSYPIKRTHELSPSQCARFPKLYAQAVADLEDFPSERYDFDRAVDELEQKIRLVDYFEYVVSETGMQRVVASFTADAAKASPEDRAQATKLAGELLGAFRSRPEGYVSDLIGQFSAVRRGLLFMSDLHRQFQGDSHGFAQFITDAIAAHTRKEDNRQLEALIPILESLLMLMDHLREPADSDKQIYAAREVREFLNSVASQGLSFEKLKSIVSILGFQGGRPGRPLEDYSTEYELWVAGKKWREVAEQRLQNDPKTREEFGGHTFSELSILDQSALMHRVRIGVGAFAKRTGRSMARTKLLATASGRARNST